MLVIVGTVCSQMYSSLSTPMTCATSGTSIPASRQAPSTVIARQSLAAKMPQGLGSASSQRRSASFALQHTGMTVVEFRDRGGVCTPRVLQLSNDAHLYRDGLPLNYQRRLRF